MITSIFKLQKLITFLYVIDKRRTLCSEVPHWVDLNIQATFIFAHDVEPYPYLLDEWHKVRIIGEKYRVIQKLGQGTFATVYMTQHLESLMQP
uniref:Protein kinase domain-containing protein n=1 Tax=Caenorhabditis tropicalis TaxID=1561998 RepID=A0A1I7UTS9_9PELO